MHFQIYSPDGAILSITINLSLTIYRGTLQFGWDALLEMEKTEDEDGNPLDRSQFNEQQFVEGGLEKEGFYGSYDQLRMLGSDVLAGGGYTPRGV